MVRFVLRRLVTSFALLILGSMAVFLLMRVIPGDPTITKLGGSIKEVDQATLDGIRAELGLDKSIPAQYVDWIGGILHGDFGSSYFSQFSVTSLVEQRYGATLLLAFMGMLIGTLIAVPASVAGAIWPNRFLSALLSGFAAVGHRDPDVRDRDPPDHHSRVSSSSGCRPRGTSPSRRTRSGASSRPCCPRSRSGSESRRRRCGSCGRRCSTSAARRSCARRRGRACSGGRSSSGTSSRTPRSRRSPRPGSSSPTSSAAP